MTPVDGPRPVTHWFDFVCPFCYVAQQRNEILREAGLQVVELPYQIHPEIRPGGAPAPVRQGPMYDRLRAEADRADLPLAWSDRLAYSRPALVRSEVVRHADPGRHAAFCAAVFDAYFAQRRDIERPEVLDACATDAGVVAGVSPAADALARAESAFAAAGSLADSCGVRGTPAWLVDDRLVVGLQPPEVFERLARELVAATG